MLVYAIIFAKFLLDFWLWKSNKRHSTSIFGVIRKLETYWV